MSKINRYIQKQVLEHLEPNKVVVIYGPRRVGKTTLLSQIKDTLLGKIKEVNGEDFTVQEWLSSERIDTLKDNLADTDILIIDEAQRVEKIGINLKLIVDSIDNIKVIATGSSSFELANQVGEPLVGRKWQYTLFPFSQLELVDEEDRYDTKRKMQETLVFGSYPEVYLEETLEKKAEILQGIIDNHLFKDIFILENLRKPRKLLDLLKLLAFQIGNEVSINELSNSLDINRDTIERYLDLLEKIFVIKRVYGFSRNLRKEITKTSRFYFFDNGVRNAVINNFNELNLRDDVGRLWENFLYIERLKLRTYKKVYANEYFWRTHDQKEVDLVEERDGKLFGFEFKWRNKRSKSPRLWLETYDNASYDVINQDNYLDFVTTKFRDIDTTA